MACGSRILTVLLAAILCVCSVAPASAYLDPGTGSLMLQGIIAAVAAGLGALSLCWQRVKSVVARLFGQRSCGSQRSNAPSE